MKNYLLRSRCAQLTRHLVNREEQGKLIVIARTNGAVTMINESNYIVKSESGYNTFIPSMQSNRDGHVHVQTIFAVISNVSMYMQSKFIAIKTRHISSLNHAICLIQYI